MKYICIVLLAFTCHTSFAMKRHKAEQNLTSPLLATQNQLQELDRARQRELSQSLPHQQHTPKGQNKRINWANDIARQKFHQQNSTAYAHYPDKALFVDATASHPLDEDLEALLRNAEPEVSLAKLNALHENIKGQVKIECLQAIEHETQKFPCILFTAFEISTITLHPNGKRLAIAGSQSPRGLILIYELEHGKWAKKIQRMETAHKPLLLAFSPNGTRMIVGYQSPNTKRVHVQVLSLETGKIITELDGFDEYKDVSNLDCGWLTEYQVVATSENGEWSAWHIPSKATGK